MITTTDSLGYRVLPKVIQRLKSTYPALKVDLRVGNDLVNITKGEADIAVRTSKNPPPHLVGRKVGKVQFVPCAGHAYLQHHPTESFPKDTSKHRFIRLDHSFSNIPAQQWFLNQLSPDDDVTIVNGMMCALELCRAGLAIAVLPSYLVAGDQELTVLPTQSTIPGNDLWILMHKDLRDAARVRATKHFLSEALITIFRD